jgi:uncharacterized membrane protein YedE/YeeE
MATTAAPTTAVSHRAQLPGWLTYGIIFGLVGAASILLWGPIGVSTTYPRFVGAIADMLDPAWATENPYLVKVGSLIKPETFLVVGLLFGGLIGVRFDKTKPARIEMPHGHAETNNRRYFESFLAGALIIFGARIAGGCTSGHIISGMMQLSISGFVFAAGTFGAGIVTAKMLRSPKGGI